MSAVTLLLVALAFAAAVVTMLVLMLVEMRQVLRDEKEARSRLSNENHRLRVAHPEPFNFKRMR